MSMHSTVIIMIILWYYSSREVGWAHPGSVQFSSFWFDNPGNAASPINRRFSCRSWAPLVGDGDDIITELAWVTINGIAQTCFSGRAKGKFLFLRRNTLQQKKPKALVGFEPRTEPELGTGDSHSTSTPLPPTRINSTSSWLLSDHTPHYSILNAVRHIPWCQKSIWHSLAWRPSFFFLWKVYVTNGQKATWIAIMHMWYISLIKQKMEKP